jgi:hypothetical protein
VTCAMPRARAPARQYPWTEESLPTSGFTEAGGEARGSWPGRGSMARRRRMTDCLPRQQARTQDFSGGVARPFQISPDGQRIGVWRTSETSRPPESSPPLADARCTRRLSPGLLDMTGQRNQVNEPQRILPEQAIDQLA